MTKYPNSACEKHIDIETSEPVCVVCMKEEIDQLRDALEAEKSNGVVSEENTAPCLWSHDISYDSDLWETGCGNAVMFEDGSPEENGYKFCHYCGKLILFDYFELEDIE